MNKIRINSLFVAATVFACLINSAIAQQSSSTDVIKATSPSIDDLDPSLIESELIEGTANSAPQVETLHTAANTQTNQESNFRSRPIVQNDFGQNGQTGFGQNSPGNNSFGNQSQGNNSFGNNSFGNNTPGNPIPANNGLGNREFGNNNFGNTGIRGGGIETNNQRSFGQIRTQNSSQNNFDRPGFNQSGIGEAVSPLVDGPFENSFGSQGIRQNHNAGDIKSLPINNGSMIETRIAPSIQTQIMSPKSINVNQSAQIYIQAQNVGRTSVKSVKLIAKLPEHAKFENSNPLPSNVNGQVYEFTLNNMAASSKQIIRINLIPTSKLPLNIATHIQTESQQQFAVTVQQPILDVDISGPQAIQTGQTVNHTVTVKNIGDGPAENVRIKPVFSENLQIASNQKTLVPRLIPGQSAKFVLSSFARDAGNSDVVFQVSATGIESRETRSDLRIIRPELNVQILGPSQNYLGREGIYTIQLENSSELPINQVEISLRVPDGLKINTISQQANVDSVTGTLKWQFPTIAGKQSQVLQFKAQALKTGNQSLDVVVTSKDIGSKQMALTTVVQGRADLSVRLSDGGEPVGIGSKSEFTIEVANHGSTIANQVNVQIQLPEALMAVSQENYSIDPSGNFIQFNSIDVAPGKTKTLKFKVVAVSEGEHVVRGSVSIEGSSQTISSENSIFVFESQNAKVSEALTPDVNR